MEKIELPKDFENLMKNLLKEDFNKYLKCFENFTPKGINLNKLKVNESILKEALPVEKIFYSANGYYLDEKFKSAIGNSFLNLCGGIYIQEPFAMIPAIALDISENDMVLDLCASPGGKSSQIAIALNKSGLLVSNEIISSRASVLYENITRMGFENVVICSDETAVFAKELPNLFDKVLVDAPCSGEGMFRKNPKAMKEWSLNQTISNSVRQLDILTNASKCLKDGGTLVYSTCTFNENENEKVVAKFLEENNDFYICDLPKQLDGVGVCGKNITNFQTNKCRRFYPFLDKGEGQFVAVLKKNGDDKSRNAKFDIKNSKYKELSNKDKQMVIQELKNVVNLDDILPRLVKKNNNIYVLPQDMINMNMVKTLCAGVLLGEIKSNRIDISHQFYSAYGNLFLNKVELDERKMQNYFSGLEVETDNNNGICVLTYKGIVLGGGKVVNGKIKNYFPKQLRIK